MSSKVLTELGKFRIIKAHIATDGTITYSNDDTLACTYAATGTFTITWGAFDAVPAVAVTSGTTEVVPTIDVATATTGVTIQGRATTSAADATMAFDLIVVGFTSV